MLGDRTFAPYVSLPLGHLGTAILKPGHLEAIIARVGAIDIGVFVPPPIGIEVPLARSELGVDLSLGFASGFGNKTALHAIKPPDCVAQTSAWRQVRRCLAFSGEPSDGIWKSIDNIWLEFDFIDRQSYGPSIYFSPLGANVFDPSEPTAWLQLPPSSRSGLDDQQITTVTDVLDHLLSDVETDMAGRDRLASCLRCYRAKEPFVLCGVMLARRTVSQRLCLRFPTVPDAAEYLDHLDIEGLGEIMSRVDAEFGDLANHILIGLEVAGDVLPRIGIEIYAGDGFCRPGGADHELITRLIELGYCDPNVAAAVLSYPGRDVIEGSEEAWLVEPLRDVGVVSGLRVPICLRRLHHVKLTMGPDRQLTAKAYLSALYRWWSPDQRRF